MMKPIWSNLMKLSAFVTAWLFLAITLFGSFAQAEHVKQNAKIVFDKENYLIFEDVGRVESDNNIAFGKMIVLHVMREGKKTDLDLGALNLQSNTPLSTEVNQIQYRDKDRVWILSRLGHILDGAILFNLATKKVDWKRAAIHLTLSPDARHLAYAFSVDRQMDCPMIFVNTVMVYPKVIPGFTRQSQTGLGDPIKEDGSESYQSLSKNQKTMHLCSEIKWINNGEIHFAMAGEDEAAQGSEKQIRIMGLEDLKNEKAIKIIVAPVAPRKTIGK